jgi:lysozyme
MKISDSGLAFIKQEEGERLTGYPDSRGIPTIGVGHTGIVGDEPVFVGMKISSRESDTLLHQDLVRVGMAIENRVTVPLTQNQYDALSSLIFNIGVTAFGRSTFLQRLNTGDYQGAADAMLMWCRAGNSPRLLLPRRERERRLFLS